MYKAILFHTKRRDEKISNCRVTAFCVITFEPIKILTHKAPQNDRLNLSFVKEVHVIGKKWPEMVVKLTFIILFHFRTVYTIFKALYFLN